MNPKILIVEDNEVIAEQLIFFLKRYEYGCRNYDTGEEALVKIIDYSPDLILMDIKLAGKMDGIETARKIKEVYDCPIIFLTSHIEPTIIEKAAAIDPAGFASKSISHSELKVQIDYTLIKHRKNKEQLKQLETFERSTKQYEAIFNSSRDAIFFIDKYQIISFWNPAAERIFGFKADIAVGKKLCDLIFSDENKFYFARDFDKWINIPSPDSNYKSMNLTVCNREGRVFTAELNLAIVDFNNDKSVCGFARDITEKVIAEEEISKLIEEMQITKEIVEQNASETMILNSKLYESEERLSELNASKDKFFSIIAHDLKGPFQGLLGYSQMLAGNLKDLEYEEIEELGKNLNEAANQLFKLLENLLSWSRIQRGTIECNPIDFDLNLLVVQNISLIDSRAKQKQIEVVKSIPDDTYVFADVNMINTVIRNLLSNAVKFTFPNGKIEISATTLGKNVFIKVKDNGIGLSKDLKERIFKIDSYQSSPGTDNEQGTGLGLILCKDLVEMNKGSIAVDSEPEKGATFTISLPGGSDK